MDRQFNLHLADLVARESDTITSITQKYWDSEKPCSTEDIKHTLCNSLISYLQLSCHEASNYLERGSSITSLVNQETTERVRTQASVDHLIARDIHLTSAYELSGRALPAVAPQDNNIQPFPDAVMTQEVNPPVHPEEQKAN